MDLPRIIQGQALDRGTVAGGTPRDAEVEAPKVGFPRVGHSFSRTFGRDQPVGTRYGLLVLRIDQAAQLCAVPV
jgi:hypothetical protein